MINDNLTKYNYKIDTETPLNEYVNDKRVYARLYEGNIPSSGTSSTQYTLFSISDISRDKIWFDNSNSFMRANNGGATLPLSWYYGASDYARFIINGNNVQIKTGGNISNGDYRIILKYTKS